MAEKKDPGGLDDDGEKERHVSDRGRTGLLVGIPALGVAIFGGLLFAFAGTGDKEPKQPDPPRADSPPLTDFTTDKFVPKPQKVEPVAAQPPADIEALAKVLEARKEAVVDFNAASPQASGSSGAQAQQTIQKRIVRSSSITGIARPDDAAGAPGGISKASVTDDGVGGGRDGEGARSGAMFSKNRLEKAYKCQASAGTNIPAMLPQGFNTEQEGEVIARVTAHVYSKDKRCLAIPMGSDLIGVYKSSGRGQQRVTIDWQAIERPYPASDTIDLDGAKAYERDGRAGLTGEVNSNIPWGMIVASTIIDLGKAALGGLGDGTSLNFGSIIGNNAGNVLDEVAKDRYQKAPASIDVEPKPILVRLNRHLPMSPFPQ